LNFYFCSLLIGLAGGVPIEDIFNLYDNNWASRIWTIQELALATKPIVMCGDSTVTWDRFFEFAKMMLPMIAHFSRNMEVIDDGMTSLSRWGSRNIGQSLAKIQRTTLARIDQNTLDTAERVQFNTWMGVTALTTFILLSRSNNCSDPRDKIYGLYGVLMEQFEHLPEVDYTIDPAKVYEDFTRAAMESTTKFWPAFVDFWQPELKSDLPSWVPDMESIYGFNIPTITLLTRAALNSTTPKPNATLQSELNLRTLQGSKSGSVALKGSAFTTITACGERWLAFEGFQADFSCFVSWILFWVNHKGLDIDNPSGQVVGGFFALGQFLLSGDPEKFRSLFEPVFTWLNELAAMNRRTFEPWLEKFSRDKIRLQFLQYVSTDLANSMLFSTSSGHFGKTFGHIEPDDTVALLAGSDWPVILRQEGENWRYIGSAYVQGIMNGEGWPRYINADDMETLVLI
jgi:hypothetical protein